MHLHEQFPAELPRLHRKAAEWYREQGDPVEAIHHLLAGKAWEEAAALIENLALRELERFGEASRLLNWFRQLPEAVIPQRRTLLAEYLRLAGIVLPATEMENLLTRMESNFAPTPSPENAGALQEALSQITQVRRLCTANDGEAPQLLPGGEDDADWHMLSGILQFARDCRSDVRRAETKASAVYETAKAKQHLHAILMAGGTCAHLALSQGHLRRSEQIANQVLRQALEIRGRFPGPAGIALTALTNVYFMRNQLAQAHQLLTRAAEVDPNPTSTSETVMIAILRAKIQSAQGDNEDALATMQAVRELHGRRPSSLWFDQDLVAYEGLFRLREGDLASAERLLSEGGEIETNPSSSFVLS